MTENALPLRGLCSDSFPGRSVWNTRMNFRRPARIRVPSAENATLKALSSSSCDNRQCVQINN